MTIAATALLAALFHAGRSSGQIEDDDTIAATRPTTPLVDPAAPNLIHGRHLHPYAASPPTLDDPSRILTDRPRPEGAPSLSLPKEEEADSFTFAVLGDRTGGPASGVNVLADAVRDVNLFDPDLVMNVGDMVQGYDTTPEWIAQMREFRAISGHLLAPLFPVAGNHDLTWRALDKSMRGRPREEHEPEYERYFAPLYYAFEYRRCGFVVLDTDEGDPLTGVHGAMPRSQRFSERQLAWLGATLDRFRSAEHVFVFMHHPRWIANGGEGDPADGDGPADDRFTRVRALLVKAGNVNMVFGGHLHRMRADPGDGIEYFTLAVTGGGQGRTAPSVGNTDHFDLITVRKGHCSVVAIPVGATMDPREITGTVMRDAGIALARNEPRIDGGPIRFATDGAVDQALRVSVANPTTRPIRVSVTPDSRDSRWRFDGALRDVEVAGRGTVSLDVRVRRKSGEIDDTCRPVELVVAQVYEMPTHDYPIPDRRVPVPLDVSALPAIEASMALPLSRATTLTVPADAVHFDGVAFTIEARFRATQVDGRHAIVGRWQTGGYSLSVVDGRLVARVQADAGVVSVTGDRPIEASRWVRAAVSYDGATLRLYVDGQLAGSAAGGGYVDDANPLGIGSNVFLRGEVRRFDDRFEGDLDWLRVSRGARYVAPAADVPDAHATADAATLLLLEFDRQFGTWTPDQSARAGLVQLDGHDLNSIK